MKKIFILSFVLLLLVNHYGVDITHEVDAETLLKYPDNFDITDEETSFEIKLNSKIKNNQRVHLEVSKDNYLISENNKYELLITIENEYLYNNQSTIIHVKHDKIVKRGDYTCDLLISAVLETYKDEPINYTSQKQEEVKSNKETPEVKKEEPVIEEPIKEEEPVIEEIKPKTITEEKTVYTYQTVSSWDYNNYTLTKPSGNYKEAIQYGYQTVLEYSDSNYLLEKPKDGYYKELIQYGYNERTKEITKVPYTVTYEYLYNNVGKCPLDCISNTENFYGSGCECMIEKERTEYKDVTNYGEWKLNESSWRTNGTYSESDVLTPISRMVYCLPSSWSDAAGWRFDNPYTQTANIKPAKRTVYLKPASYSDISAWQDQEIEATSETKVSSKKVCRLFDGYTWSAWEDCA